MTKETELKLAFPPQAVDILRQHPLLTGLELLDRDALENSYFDTPEQILSSNRIALRKRRTRDQLLQTIKCAAPSTGGLSQRPEWESPISGDFDFSRVTDTPTRELLITHAASIVPLFVTDFARETRVYAPREDLRILVMLDHGHIQAAGRSTPIAELELELVRGNSAELFDFAMMLSAELPLMPEDLSKAERGYMLLQGMPRKPARGARIQLTPDMTVAAAFHAVASDILQSWQANALGALLDDSPEFIHQLRVALRRLRTLLRLFEEILPHSFTQWQQQLAELASVAGQTRDLDVLESSLLEPAHHARGAPSLKAIERLRAKMRQRAHLDTFSILASPSSRLLLLGFARDLHMLQLEARTPLFCLACQQLTSLRKLVAKRLKIARETGKHADLHRLRIAFKRLRYAFDFFSGMFATAQIPEWREKMSLLQDQLGLINDVDTGLDTLQDWAADAPDIAPAVAWLTRFHAARLRKSASEALVLAESLLELRRPWQSLCNKFET